MSAIDDIETALLRKAVLGLRIESSYTPPIQMDDPFAPSAPPSLDAPTITAGWVMNKLRPKLTVLLPGERQIAVAPFGEPDPEGFDRMIWPLRIGLAVVGSLTFIGLITSLRWLLHLELSAPPTRALPAARRSE